jgi:hypothetical protein
MSTTIGGSTVPEEADGSEDKSYIMFEGRLGEPSACNGRTVGVGTTGGPDDIY